ncbi:MAG: DNA-3-methyladenine glycosylase 2 family protein [Acidaminococcaceae bacterium]|nr:DNA-3-methyladenine glycosylase 2 family protein [Acidaminococcaceae bacterium]
MQKTPNWLAGEQYLRVNAPELAPFMEQYGHCNMKPDCQERYFEVLLTGIAAQQLPPEVSRKIMDQLRRLAGNPVTPEKLLSLTDETIVTCGLTAIKITYMKEFARLVMDHTVDFSLFAEMTDAQIVKLLKTVKGLGQWTIEMFMLLSLCRPDVLPGDDFLLKKEVKLLFALDEIPKRGQLNKLMEPWRPWRSLAVWYLWQHSADIKKK